MQPQWMKKDKEAKMTSLFDLVNGLSVIRGGENDGGRESGRGSSVDGVGRSPARNSLMAIGGSSISTTATSTAPSSRSQSAEAPFFRGGPSVNRNFQVANETSHVGLSYGSRSVPVMKKEVQNNDLTPVPNGTRVRLRDASMLNEKVAPFANTLGVITRVPNHPDTWYTIVLENDDYSVIKARRTYFDPLQKASAEVSFKEKNFRPPALERPVLQAKKISGRLGFWPPMPGGSLNGKTVVVKTGKHRGRHGIVFSPSKVPKVWLIDFNDSVRVYKHEKDFAVEEAKSTESHMNAASILLQLSGKP